MKSFSEVWIVECSQERRKKFESLLHEDFEVQFFENEKSLRQKLKDKNAFPEYLILKPKMKNHRFESRENVLKRAQVILDPYELKVTRNGISSRLTVLEFKIIEIVLNEPNYCSSRKKLQSDLWKNRQLSANALNVHICNLRNKLKLCDLKIVFNKLLDAYAIRNMDGSKF